MRKVGENWVCNGDEIFTFVRDLRSWEWKRRKKNWA